MRQALLSALLLVPALAGAEAPYAYQPGVHRDPFTEPGGAKPTVDPTRCTESPLCAVKLEEVKLTAIVTGQAKPLAMIEDGKGEYLIREGMRIGANGVVAHIRAGRVVINEVVYASGNAPRTIERVLTIDPEI